MWSIPYTGSPMETITVFQDYKINISQYKEYFDDILLIKEIIGSQNCLLEANGDLQIRNYIGTFSSGRISLQVLPKIYQNTIDSEEEQKESLELIYRLLVWSNYLGFKKLSASRSVDSADSLLEIIIRIFTEEFLSLHRKNVYREYRLKEEEQMFIKGKVLFHKSISSNPAKSLYKTVQYDDLTINNLINQIIKTLFTRILPHTQSSANRQSIRLALAYLEEVEQIPVNEETFNNLQYNRINEEYRPLMELARILLNRQQPGMSVGKKPIISFTLQLNLLYEYFVNSLLEEIYTYPYVVGYQKGGYLAKDSNEKDCFLLQPDFKIEKNTKKGKNTKTEIILDTKFKNPIDNQGKLKISSSDIYQMCTYAIRFDCKNIILIYPLFLGQERLGVSSFIINHGQVDFNISVIQIDILSDDLDVITEDLRGQLENIRGKVFS